MMEQADIHLESVKLGQVSCFIFDDHVMDQLVYLASHMSGRKSGKVDNWIDFMV